MIYVIIICISLMHSFSFCSDEHESTCARTQLLQLGEHRKRRQEEEKLVDTAIQDGNFKRVRILINEGKANPHYQPDQQVNSRLLQAIRGNEKRGSREQAIIALSPFTDLTYRSQSGDNPLSYAHSNNFPLTTISTLIGFADIQARNNAGLKIYVLECLANFELSRQKITQEQHNSLKNALNLAYFIAYCHSLKTMGFQPAQTRE